LTGRTPGAGDSSYAGAGCYQDPPPPPPDDELEESPLLPDDELDEPPKLLETGAADARDALASGMLM
jgi:hypothetical protein